MQRVLYTYAQRLGVCVCKQAEAMRVELAAAAAAHEQRTAREAAVRRGVLNDLLLASTRVQALVDAVRVSAQQLGRAAGSQAGIASPAKAVTDGSTGNGAATADSGVHRELAEIVGDVRDVLDAARDQVSL